MSSTNASTPNTNVYIGHSDTATISASDFPEFARVTAMFTSSVHMPAIDEVIFNGTHTVVKWDDNSTTVVNCIVEDDFNYEVGLAMAISRKYFERANFSGTPRADFLNTIERARVIDIKEK